MKFGRWIPPYLLTALATGVLLCSCSSVDDGAEPSVDAGTDVQAVDATQEQDAAPDVVPDVAVDVAVDVTPDVLDDVTEEIDAAPDAPVGWAGEPWYGCTTNDEPPNATVVTAFELDDHYFNPEDRRTIESQVDFPATGQWDRIDMRVELDCPADGDCDNWDRFANLLLVEDPGGTNEQALELERYITPYNVGMCFLTDVTRFAPKLSGTKTLRSFIDTWVGPNEPSQGHGWRVTVKFIFHPGTPDPSVVPDEVVQLWSYGGVEIGNADAPFADAMGEHIVPIPAGVSRAELRVVATGHGQGNRSNCAEFCRLAHELTVNGSAFSFDPWRGNCADNPIGPSQSGTWKYGRAGWCPGAYVLPKVFDVTTAVQAGQDATFSYDSFSETLGPYENTCRPGVGDSQNQCIGCAFGTAPNNCDYNGGSHTPPEHRISVQLLLYK